MMCARCAAADGSDGDSVRRGPVRRAGGPSGVRLRLDIRREEAQAADMTSRRKTPEPADRSEPSSLPLQVLKEMDPELVRKLLDARIRRSWTLQPCTGFDPPPE
ncbi:hypothetical protein Psi01_21150 [Planobispora siamensis]|uniref:Uncharacterized protein n=2 Tax=Planobispora siamensis TaxID=936338 RepID=A0A8J3SE86_9ACTN|nr:hypothetical protein Psi01_21150 [Planobispora siamensis]